MDDEEEYLSNLRRILRNEERRDGEVRIVYNRILIFVYDRIFM